MNNNLKQLPIQSLVDNGAKHMGLTDRDSASATAMQKPASQYIDTQGVKQILVLPKSSLIRSTPFKTPAGLNGELLNTLTNIPFRLYCRFEVCERQ